MKDLRRLIASYLFCGLVFLTLDAAWLSLMGERLYRAQLGPVLAAAPRFGPAVAFYLIYLAGLVGFCVTPALATDRPRGAFARGGFFGIVAYATYDLTNQATLVSWPMDITAADLVWGGFASAVSAGAAALIVHRWQVGARGRIGRL